MSLSSDLKVTLPGLVTYGAVQRMVHQQKLHHSLSGTHTHTHTHTHQNVCRYVGIWSYAHLAFLVASEKVFTLIPGSTGMAHAAWGCR